MNIELERLNNWFKANRLCLNVKKTKFILFKPQGGNIANYNGNIILNGENVDQISNHSNEKSFKFLGIHIDESLSWKHHINKVTKKISSANYIINKVKNILPKSSLRNLYSSLIHSHINYGLPIWGSARNLNSVFKLQKRSIRIINGKPYKYHTEPLFKSSQILKVKDQYHVNSLIFMHKLMYHKLPRSFDCLDYFKPGDKPLTRQSDLAQCTKPRTTFSSLLPYHQFPRIWNELDAGTRNMTSLSQFKNTVKKLLTDKYESIIFCDNMFCKQCYPA